MYSQGGSWGLRFVPVCDLMEQVGHESITRRIHISIYHLATVPLVRENQRLFAETSASTVRIGDVYPYYGMFVITCFRLSRCIRALCRRRENFCLPVWMKSTGGPTP